MRWSKLKADSRVNGLKLLSFFMFAAAAAMTLAAAPAAATPMARPVPDEGIVASIPFDPPLGQELRYRTEKVVEKRGKTRSTWQLASYRFDKADTGYTLTVTPLSSGSGEGDPLAQAIEKQLAELSRRPYVLVLGENGEITEMRDAERYWSAIFEAIDAALKDSPPGGEKLPAQAKPVLDNILRSMRNLPAEARLALLTESVQPLVNFAATDTVVGKPIETQVEVPSPFGGFVKQDVRIALTRVADDTAFLTVRSSIARSELEALSKRFVAKAVEGTAMADKAAEAAQAFAGLERFSRNDVGEYQISLADGTLLRFVGTETVEAGGASESTRDVTTTIMQRVD